MKLDVLAGSAQGNQDDTRYVATIGSFDGVHRGHQFLIGKMVEGRDRQNRDRAGSRRLRTLVVTFDPLPFEVLHSGHEPSRLTDIEERVSLLKALGVDEVAVVPFTSEVAQQPPEEFLAALNARYPLHSIWCGEDFAFGHNREGTVEFLRQNAPRFGYSLNVVPRIDLDGSPLGSSVVRKLVADGAVESATGLLGHYPSVSGVVVRGMARGRQLGYPTANLSIPSFRLIPKIGIYAGFASLGSERHMAAISVGRNPTFDQGTAPTGGVVGVNPISVEAYLLDFDRDIWGEPITYDFAFRLRDEIKFDTVGDLVDQIARDVDRTRELTAA